MKFCFGPPSIVSSTAITRLTIRERASVSIEEFMRRGYPIGRRAVSTAPKLNPRILSRREGHNNPRVLKVKYLLPFDGKHAEAESFFGGSDRVLVVNPQHEPERGMGRI